MRTAGQIREPQGRDRLLAGHYVEKAGYRIRRPHGREDWLIVLTCGGQGRFAGSGGWVEAGVGDVVLIAPHTPQDYGISRGSEWDILWAHFHTRPHWRDWLDWPEPSPGIRQLCLAGRDEGAKVGEHLEDVARLAHSGAPHSRLFAMAALEEALLWCHAANPLSANAHWDPRVREAMDYMRRRLGDPLSLADVAAHCGLSVSRMGHLFAAQAGVTPQRFLEEQRMEMARQLLDTTNRQVHAIAESVGFENPFYFSLRFKRWVGMNPTQYRRREPRP